jgi:uncharacterized protein
MLRPGKDKGLATPVPLGLAGLAATTFLIGFGVIFQAPAAWAPYFVQALLFGGLVEFIAGMWAFGYGDPLAATTFSFLGVFNAWWALSQMTFLGAHAAGAATMVSSGMVLIVTGVVTLSLWVASFSESAAFNLTLLFLWISYMLLGIEAFTDAGVLGILGGIAALVSGLIGAYASFAEVYNATTMRQVIPVGEPAMVCERSEREEHERIHRIHLIDGSASPRQTETSA